MGNGARNTGYGLVAFAVVVNLVFWIEVILTATHFITKYW